MSHVRFTGSPLPWLIVVLTCGLLSCETFDTTLIDPFRGQNRHFTIYGFVEEASPEHRVRVIPVRRTPPDSASPEPDESIDAEVASVDLVTGLRTVWTHELSHLDDGTIAHTYSTDTRIESGRPYRLEVTRSDSAQSTATTVVPILPSSTQPQLDEPVQFQGEVFQSVHLTGIPRAFSIEVVYDVSYGGDFVRVIRDYGRSGAADQDGYWTFTIDLSRDTVQVLQEVQEALDIDISLNQISLYQIGVRAKWIDDQWPDFDEPIDLDHVAQPGVLSNVENGDGFFGSIGIYRRSWEVDDPELIALLGFR